MRGQANTLAFIDLLFNLLLGITFMFIMAFLMINPISQTGQVDPPVLLMVELMWEEGSKADLDLWVRSHDNTWIGYTNKDGNYITLERDDLGETSDTYVVNGQTITVERNYEVVNFTALPAGEYVVNVHYFSGGPIGQALPEEFKIKVTQVSPYKLIHEGSFTLTLKGERTMLSFIVNHDGFITDIRTDIQIPFRSEQMMREPNDL